MSGPPPLPLTGGLLAGVASGGLLALATWPGPFGPLCFVALVPLLVATERRPTPTTAALSGWLCGIVFFGSALAWVAELDDAPALGLLAGYVAILSTGLASVFMLLAWLRGGGNALSLLALPPLWVGFEFARAQGTLGYPWHWLGYGLADHAALLQLAAIGGTLSLSLWVVATNCVIAHTWCTRRRPPAVALVVLAPLLLAPRAFTTPDVGGLRVAAIQPAIAESGRDSPEQFRDNLERLLSLSREALGDEPDLLVWPESAFERSVASEGDLLLSTIANHLGTDLLTGTWRRAAGGVYNSSLLARADGSMRVAGDKVHPVGFYESSPQTSFERWLASRRLWRGGFSPGVESGLIEVDDVRAGILVCFDSSFSALARSLRRRGAEILIEISNEAPTTLSTARQHARVSRLRAVETGLPLVRVANTGPSEWTTSRGRVIEQTEPGEVSARTVELGSPVPLTPYVTHGDAPVLVSAALCLLAVLTRRVASQGDSV